MTNPKPKPATIGEREVCLMFKVTLDWLRNGNPKHNHLRQVARRYDAVVKRAFSAGVGVGTCQEREGFSNCEHCERLAKYGVKARGK